MSKRDDLSDHIRQFRERNGLTQAKLAALLGLEKPSTSGRVQVIRWENPDDSLPASRRPPTYIRLALERVEQILEESRRTAAADRQRDPKPKKPAASP